MATKKPGLSAAQRREKTAWLEKTKMAIINAKLNDYLEQPLEKRDQFEIKIARLCVRHNKVKEELGL